MFQPDLFKETREGQLLISLPATPRAWARTMGGKTKKLFTPQALRDYYDSIKLLASSQLPIGWKPFEEPCDVELFLGKEWSQIRVTINPHRPRILRGDLSNYLKAHEDGLQGLLWLNDRQICRVHVEEVDVKLTEAP